MRSNLATLRIIEHLNRQNVGSIVANTLNVQFNVPYGFLWIRTCLLPDQLRPLCANRNRWEAIFVFWLDNIFITRRCMASTYVICTRSSATPHSSLWTRSSATPRSSATRSDPSQQEIRCSTDSTLRQRRKLSMSLLHEYVQDVSPLLDALQAKCHVPEVRLTRKAPVIMALP